MKIKSILEEDIIEKIDKSIIDSSSPSKIQMVKAPAQNQKKNKKINQQKASQQDNGLIKSTAGTLLKQKIESKAETDSILKMADKYN